MIYVKDMITSYVNTEVKQDVNSESIWIELINGRKKLIISNTYTPPNLSREGFTLLFQGINAAAKYRNVCIIGDFNYRNVDWISIVGDRESDDFINAIQDNYTTKKLLERSKIIAMSEAGLMPTEISRRLGICRQSVSGDAGGGNAAFCSVICPLIP